MVAVAASVVALVVASIALVVATRDDPTVVDQPEPTVTPALPEAVEPAPTTVAAPDPAAAQAVVDEFFTAYNAGNTVDVMALIADDAVATERYLGSASDAPASRHQVERRFAWKHAQGEVWSEATCELAGEPLPAGTTLACQWDTLDAPVLAVDGDPIPTNARIAVADSQITEIHFSYSSPDFTNLGMPFVAWVTGHHPRNAEHVDCCEGDTPEESVQRGQVRAQMASEWANWLEEWGCTDEPAMCTLAPERWVAEYDTQCLALGATDGLQSLVDHMAAFLRSAPPSIGLAAARNGLLAADQALLEPGLSGERVAELQQQRLDAMIELGIDERCHPDSP